MKWICSLRTLVPEELNIELDITRFISDYSIISHTVFILSSNLLEKIGDLSCLLFFEIFNVLKC